MVKCFLTVKPHHLTSFQIASKKMRKTNKQINKQTSKLRVFVKVQEKH